jgi:hypothetical protein
VAELLPSKHEALSSNSNATKKENFGSKFCKPKSCQDFTWNF